ncbi:LysM peptidoglycan-binding domain-containing protein [Weissella paramesenteroides]|uniref:LysM peptidoglycan-binding domain-containing protein n=1 Tax=Weissella paramesenteroides TaxID=1249 RepID=UPI003F747531
MSKKRFNSGKILLTGVVAASLISTTTLTEIFANSGVNENTYWQANSQLVIQKNMNIQHVYSTDDLSNYRVVWGDTLSGIAKYFNISVEELAIRYHIVNPNFILAGVTLEDQHLFTVLDYSVLPSETIQDTSFNFVQATKNIIHQQCLT